MTRVLFRQLKRLSVAFLAVLFVLTLGCRKNSDWTTRSLSELIPRYHESKSYHFELFDSVDIFRFEPSPDFKTRTLKIVEKAVLTYELESVEKKKRECLDGPGPYLFPPAGKIVLEHDELSNLEIKFLHSGLQVYVVCGTKVAVVDTLDDAKELVEFLDVARAEQLRQRRNSISDCFRRYIGIFLIGSISSVNEWQAVMNFLELLLEETRFLLDREESD